MSNVNKYADFVFGRKTRERLLLILLSIVFCFGCKKLVSIPEPLNSITTAEVFSNDAQANSAMAGVYAYLNQQYGLSFADGSVTLYCGMSADEVINFAGPNNTNDYQFYDNNLVSNNSVVATSFWQQPYYSIYQTNAIISGLNNSGGIDDSTKNELLGEAYFIRAFSNFYLANMFGNVPLVLTINYNKTSSLSRTDTATIYNQIINDLKQAQLLLRSDYSYILADGERIIPNKWAATALLARVYLYQQDWAGAYAQSNSIINDNQDYSLVSNLANVFNANSSEAIWQLKQNTNAANGNATAEGLLFVPSFSFFSPKYYLSRSLINGFEPNDLRFATWIDSTNYRGTIYYYPYKYTIGPRQKAYGGTAPTQYYMILRLAEQYLIRAESEAHGQGGGVNNAISDINAIRNRSGLSNTLASTQSEIESAIIQERRVELFCEWGHRWMDLKRWGNATTVLTVNKNINIDAHDLLYPIPQNEIINDPNLQQNPGY